MTTTPATLTLTTFLLAQLDADEAVARAAVKHGEGALDWGDEGDPTDRHIARHDPAHVLADVDAKRQIVALGESQCGSYDDGHGGHHYPDPEWGFCDGCAAAESADNDHRRVLRLLALPYADSPDFREEWRA